MSAPVGLLGTEVPAGSRGDPSAFDRDGCAVGRAVFAPEVIRALRAQLVDVLVADGHIEQVEEHADRFRWVSDTTFNRHDYEDCIKADVENLLLKTGLAAKAIDAIWGKPAAIWEGIQLFVAIPGNLPPVPGIFPGAHRDATPLAASTESSGQVRLWLPLTQLSDGDGALALAVGSHDIRDEPGDAPPMKHALHPDLLMNGAMPAGEQLAPLWRTARLAVGDAIVFRSDVVHTAAPNTGSCLRLSIVLTAQDARVPIGYSAGLSLDSARDLTDIERVVLALLAVQPTSRWWARCAFYPRGIAARLWGEQPKDRVERVFTTLEARGLIAPHEPHIDPKWEVHRLFDATPRGSSEVTDWLTTPSISDTRLLTLKLLLCDWLNLDTTALLAEPGEIRNRPPEPLSGT